MVTKNSKKDATCRLQVSIDQMTDNLLTEIAETGIIGTKKNEVVRYMIQEFIKNEWVKNDLRTRAKEMAKEVSNLK